MMLFLLSCSNFSIIPISFPGSQTSSGHYGVSRNETTCKDVAWHEFPTIKGLLSMRPSTSLNLRFHQPPLAVSRSNQKDFLLCSQ